MFDLFCVQLQCSKSSSGSQNNVVQLANKVAVPHILSHSRKKYHSSCRVSGYCAVVTVVMTAECCVVYRGDGFYARAAVGVKVVVPLWK